MTMETHAKTIFDSIVVLANHRADATNPLIRFDLSRGLAVGQIIRYPLMHQNNPIYNTRRFHPRGYDESL